MPALEELTDALLECLREVSDLLDQGITIADAQREALIASDAEKIAVTCTSYQEILRRLAQTDERAAAIAARIADENGIEGEVDVESVADTVDSSFSPLISAELVRISALAVRLREANDINSTLLSNGLDIITTCLRIVANDPEPTVYSSQASMAGSSVNILSLDSRV
ncbi:MAG: flagellar protein FlgN [Armatimonadetes bacterium]|nr:flagellar protein FlgN [Armatimonadota bacterium]